jgi:DNA-binding transcriptional MerR regulator
MKEERNGKEISFKEACEIASRGGVTPRGLQWYATKGLIPKPIKVSTKSFYYDRELISYLFVIEQLHSYGFSIKEIRQFFKQFRGNITEISDMLINLSLALNDIFINKKPDEDVGLFAHINLKSSIKNQIKKFLTNEIKDISNDDIERLVKRAYTDAGNRVIRTVR